MTETNPQRVENFLHILRDHTAGDPMRADVKWTNLSRRQISRRLKELGTTPAGKNVVSRLLWEHGYRRRKPQKKRTMGSHDTTELACESIELGWREQGRKAYPQTDALLVPCDGGGSNRSSKYLFEEDLQALSNRLGLQIRIAHYPPYCSKYNPIEHRVFPHVTRACKGVPLETIETARHYMEKTETTKGLSVVVRIIDTVFQTGRKYAAHFKKNMTIKFDECLPNWNYTAIPDTK